MDGKNLLDLSDIGLANVRSQTGMIFQHFNLLSSRTVFDNVTLPLELQGLPRQQIKKRIAELLTLVGIEDKQTDYPASLSGGQKQRVAIARALASSPTVLLCDEATSALDPGTNKSILSLLKDINLRLSITILLITHEIDVVKMICDNVAVLSAGKLIEQGTVGDIFSNPFTPLTKKFIDASLNIDIPAEYKKRLAQHRT